MRPKAFLDINSVSDSYLKANSKDKNCRGGAVSLPVIQEPYLIVKPRILLDDWLQNNETQKTKN